MKIANNRTVADLRADFNKVFPYLNIEFYSTPHKLQELLPKDKLIRHDAALKQCRKTNTESEITLNPEWTVAQFEQTMWEQFDLSVQVFRKSGALWIETSLTDKWTLRQQNFEGEQMSANQSTQSNIDLYDRDQAE